MDNNLDFSTLSDYELTSHAQAGNKNAENFLLLKYWSLTEKISSQFYMNGSNNDDIFQEGMLGLYSAILDYKPDFSSFKSFACVCIKRKIISALKASKRLKNIPLNLSVSLDRKVCDNSDEYLIDRIENSSHNNPENIFIKEENMKHYDNLIKSILSDFEYKVYSLRLEGYSYKEISERLNKDIKGVDNAIQRIKNKLLVLFE